MNLLNSSCGSYHCSLHIRYYYAIVECDSIKTAETIYTECDDLEVERSSNVLDLRFVPDGTEFPHPPRDVATAVPPDYKVSDSLVKV